MFFKRKKVEKPKENKNIEFQVDISNLDKFILVIEEMSGSSLSHKKNSVSNRLENYCKNNNIKSFDEVINLIKKDENIKQDIMNLVTVNETYFYREIAQLEEVIKYAKTLSNPKIICAPCSTGDEVYSLCMLAYENNIKDIEILGIDLSSTAIDKAHLGIYDARHLHRLNIDQKKCFFSKIDDKFKIKKELFPKVTFKVINIFDNEFLKLGTFDIVLSRNMMIYFNKEFRLKCVKNLSRILQDSGRLYIGHADLMPDNEIFTKEFTNSVVYYKKR